MGTFPTVLTAITAVAYLWTKLFFFSEYRTKGIKLLFSEIILSRSLSLSCVSITAEEVPCMGSEFHWYRFGIMYEK